MTHSGPTGSSHKRLKPRTAASEAHRTKVCRPRGRGRRLEMLEVDSCESATSWSQSSVEFQTDRPVAAVFAFFLLAGLAVAGALRLVGAARAVAFRFLEMDVLGGMMTRRARN